MQGVPAVVTNTAITTRHGSCSIKTPDRESADTTTTSAMDDVTTHALGMDCHRWRFSRTTYRTTWFSRTSQCLQLPLT